MSKLDELARAVAAQVDELHLKNMERGERTCFTGDCYCASTAAAVQCAAIDALQEMVNACARVADPEPLLELVKRSPDVDPVIAWERHGRRIAAAAIRALAPKEPK